MSIFNYAALSSQIDVWIGQVVPKQSIAEPLQPLLQIDELQRANRYKFPDLQNRFIQRRAILRRILGQYLDHPPAELELTTNAFGKPQISEAHSSELQFSLTHSGDWLAIAITRNQPVGIDLEIIRENVDCVGLAENFFAPEDITAICSQSDENQIRAKFFEIWTAKEAYIKAIGTGLSIPLDKFYIDLITAEPHLAYATHDYGGSLLAGSDTTEMDPAKRWFFERLPWDEQIRICVATIGQSFPVKNRGCWSLWFES